jgi:hypothetical protein
VEPAIVVAVIALAGSLLSAGIVVFGQIRTMRARQRGEAEAILAKYQEPLAYATYELQSRLFNILDEEKRFLRHFYSAKEQWKREYAVYNTLYVIGQYFAWTEILRREIQFLNFSEVPRTMSIARRQTRIVKLFQSDDQELGDRFMIWQGEQRAIGELMTTRENGPTECRGYADFLEQMDQVSFRRWFGRLEKDIDAAAKDPRPNPRLVRLQVGLLDLLGELDPKGIRFRRNLIRLG